MIVTVHVTEILGYGITLGDLAGWILQGCAMYRPTGIIFKKKNDK